MHEAKPSLVTAASLTGVAVQVPDAKLLVRHSANLQEEAAEK